MDPPSWVVHASLLGSDDGGDASTWEQYQWSVFKALAQMIMVGYQTAPFTNVGCDTRTEWCGVETWFTLLCLYIGAVLYAYLISQLSSILFNADGARKRFEDRLASANSFCRQIRLPAELRERVRLALDRKYRTRRLNDEQLLLADLPPGLRAQIRMHTTASLFQKVPILARASTQFLEHLAGIVTSVVAFPNETLLHEGAQIDIGALRQGPDFNMQDAAHASDRRVYFVESGIVQIMSAFIGGKTLCVIADGCYFGDVSVLLGGRRTATAKAKTTCQLWAVPGAPLLRLLAEHPELSAHMAKVAEKRRARVMHLDRNRQLGLLSPEVMEDEEDMKTRMFSANAHRFSGHRLAEGLTVRRQAGGDGGGKVTSPRGNFPGLYSKRNQNGGREDRDGLRDGGNGKGGSSKNVTKGDAESSGHAGPTPLIGKPQGSRAADLASSPSLSSFAASRFAGKNSDSAAAPRAGGGSSGNGGGRSSGNSSNSGSSGGRAGDGKGGSGIDRSTGTEGRAMSARPVVVSVENDSDDGDHKENLTKDASSIGGGKSPHRRGASRHPRQWLRSGDSGSSGGSQRLAGGGSQRLAGGGASGSQRGNGGGGSIGNDGSVTPPVTPVRVHPLHSWQHDEDPV
ncbi:unnamed protein product [Phaeothamnion confervicola]